MCHSNRITSIPLPLKCNQHLTLFSVYAPTLMADPAIKNSFHFGLRRYLNTSTNDKVLILGVLNTWVVRDSVAWKVVLDRRGVGNCNVNGLLLHEFCTECQLAITNTIIQHIACLKTTSMHHRSKHCHLLDYVLVCHLDLKDVLDTKAMPRAECHADHHLVRCEPKLQFKPKLKKKGNFVK